MKARIHFFIACMAGCLLLAPAAFAGAPSAFDESDPPEPYASESPADVPSDAASAISAGTYSGQTTLCYPPTSPSCSGTSGRMYFTGFFIMVHSPESLSYEQLQKASQFLLSMLGLSARK